MPGDLEADINNPYLFSENQAGKYTYSVDEYGMKSAYGSLKLADESHRDNAAQRTAGGLMRRGIDSEGGPDDGGHSIGARFGGSTGEENLTAQNRNVNRGQYKSLENQWEKHLKDGEKVYVYIETDNGQRPGAYMGYTIYETPSGERSWNAFHIVNENKSELIRWMEEADKLTTQSETYLGQAGKAEGNNDLRAASAEINEYLGFAGQMENEQNSEMSDESGISL